MVTVTHTPTPAKHLDGGTYDKHWTIIGDNVDELVEEALKLIRPISRSSYQTSIREDLQSGKGYAYVDVHAGQGREYDVRLRPGFLVDKKGIQLKAGHWAMYVSHIYGMPERFALIEEVTEDTAKIRIFSLSEKYSQVEEFNQAKLYQHIDQLSQATEAQIAKQMSFLVTKS